MWVRVLGPAGVVLDGSETVELGARKPRSVLAALALRLGSDVAADALVELVWGDEAPRGAHGTLHSYVSGVRRALEPGLGPRQPPTILVSGDHGYRLALRRDQVDATSFADEVRARHRELVPLASQFTTGPTPQWPGRDAIVAHVDRLEELLGRWTGEPYADLPDLPEVLVERAALEQLRLNAEEDRVLGLLALGDHAVVVAATEQAIHHHPLQERLWALHALALVRSGRQADALASLRRIRNMLAEELGIDPGQELRDLERSVLEQAPGLQEWRRPSAAPLAPATVAERVRHPDATEPAAWSTVGRQAEESRLHAVLHAAAAGTASYAQLVGDPGTGKSRLVAATRAEAEARGFTVAVGRCSQDDGAPPLWPWAEVLRALGDAESAIETLLTGPAAAAGESAERQAFRAWDGITRRVLEHAQYSPVLLVLEDLHWADAASMRVLRHLVTLSSDERVAVLVTRRPLPEPTGALAEVSEELARRHAERIELGGLEAADAALLVGEVSGGPVPADVAERWHQRSGGNPYFLVELARLGPGTDELPASVRDVILRRLQSLPEDTRQLLLLAATLGRECSVPLLARVAEVGVDETDDLLQPARAAGLVHEPEVDVVAFTHALTRDAVASSTSPSRLARLHARVARTLEDEELTRGLVTPGERVSELARHWSAAGPSYAPRAWRAALAAADLARRAFSFEEAEQLMGAVVAGHRLDPHGTPLERYDLLLARAEDRRHLSEWDQILPLVAEAVALAREADDVALLARAAAYATHDVVWLPQGWNEVLEDVVEDLRWGLRHLPSADSPERCRLMLSLAVQLYYDASAVAEVVALAEAAVDMARRLQDPPLLSWATHTAWLALWSPRHAEQRRELATEGLAAAVATGDADSEVVALVSVAGVALELGDRTAYLAAAEEGERLARSRRNTYALMALWFVRYSLAALSGDAAQVRQLAAELMEIRPRRNPEMEAVFVAGLQMTPALWNGEAASMVDALAEAEQQAGDDMLRAITLSAAARSGRPDILHRVLGRPPQPVVENWSSVSDWADEIEAAAVVGDADLAAASLESLSAASGGVALSGIASASGPVDGYLALALVTIGRTADATAAADRAQQQADEWGWQGYLDWLAGRRSEFGF